MNDAEHDHCRRCGDSYHCQLRNLRERIKELKADNKKLREIKCPPISEGDSCICPIEDLEKAVNEWRTKADAELNINAELHTLSANQEKRIKGLETENEQLEDALARIDNWAKAYPIKAFPEPDLIKVHEILKAHGLSLDAVSASNMRHVLDGVKDIVKQALKPRI